MINKVAIEYLKEVQSHIDLENGGNTQKIYDAIDMAIKALENRPTGKWIETAKEYYEAVNERSGGVDEHTPYFVDDIACPKCLAMFSTIDNETERFNYCPNCGAKMEDEGKKERDAYWDEAMKWHDKLEGGRE